MSGFLERNLSLLLNFFTRVEVHIRRFTFPSSFWNSRSKLHGNVSEIYLEKWTRMATLYFLKWSKSTWDAKEWHDRSIGQKYLHTGWKIIDVSTNCFNFVKRNNSTDVILICETFYFGYCFQIYSYREARIVWLSTRPMKKFFLPLDVA